MLQEILVDEWGFDGYVVSDWGGSNDHALGVMNGSHLEMPGTGKSGMRDIVRAVKDGTLPEEVLDQRLDTFYISGCHFPCMIRIFGKILKVTSTEQGNLSMSKAFCGKQPGTSSYGKRLCC